MQGGIGAQKRDQIRGMGKIPSFVLLVRHVLRAVAAQGKHLMDPFFRKAFGNGENILLFAPHTGKMCKRLQMQGVLDIGCDLQGFLGLASSGTVGDADKIG